MSLNQFVFDQYKTTFGRNPSVEGQNYWVDQLSKGNVTKDNFKDAFLGGASADDLQRYNSQPDGYAFGHVDLPPGRRSGGGDGWNPPSSQGPDIFQPDLYQKSRSGLPEKYQNQVLERLIPRLLKSVDSYEGNVDKSTQAAQELFESQSRRGMKDQLQGILNSLAGRNILDSSVASDTIAKGMGDIVQTGAQKGYESQMNNAALKAQLPVMLANIAQLGQSSTSENPLEPYKLLAQYDWNLM